ncbi:protein-glutamine gamma-glutamyltransferase K-like, partial [Lingula anatina]|uniref:Protein-glutamine gamma-glutamyltransferase K-like n=1 Tax=Lingula anatina TaxID=7574 RepID=A0A1S3IG18_LINAN
TNSLDDDGILVGNWSGDYSGGTAPTAWVGSVAILEEYWKTKQPVKFGQCWVFSGVVTTLCRALGIPCRSVTNFASAHDVDASITIDMYWTSDGKPMEDANFDSIWNFHVWNDVWMARPDLPPGYSGWQAIDATPQETSDGIYCSGPCSVNALRDGVITLPYDGPFIFAEVNADKVHYIQKSNGEFRSVIQKDIVGKRISTRLPDGFARRAVVGSIIDDPDRHDITSQYKHTEGTAEERAALMKAISTSTRQDIYDDVGDDVKFNFVDKDDIFIGSDFDVEVKVTNTSDEERNVTITLSATVCRYTGVPVAQLKNEQFQIKLEPKSGEQSVKMACTVDEYLPKLVEGASMKIGGMAWVKETGQVHADLDDFRLRRPDLKVEAKCLDDSGIFRVGVPFDLVVSLTNPLNKQLTKCEWFIEGPGLQKPKRIKHASDVAANALVDLTYQMTPRRTGTRQIAVGFDTVELPDITGSAIIEVKPAA